MSQKLRTERIYKQIMRFTTNVMVLLVFVVSIVQQLRAQQTYQLQGRVINAATNEPLVGASVYHNEANYSVSTDQDGNFRIGNIRSSTAQFTISYLGYQGKIETFTFPRDGQRTVTISLQSLSSDIETVTVVGSSFEGQERALNQQRSADNIKNIISSDLMGKFPDQNVAEALQRVPGVNITRDKGEGSNVSIRGTPPHFTNISINGEQIVSVSQGGGRAEALDLIPADQLGSMEVTKALTADMDGDAIGGNINLRTPTARTLKLQVRGDGGLGYNDLAGNINGLGRLRLSQRFFADDNTPQGKLGVMLSSSYYRTNNSEDRMDATWRFPDSRFAEDQRILPTEYQFRRTENIRTRIGATATIDYRINPNHDFVFNYMFNSREDDDLRNRFRFDLMRNSTSFITDEDVTMTNTRVRRDINFWRELKTNHNFNLEGRHAFGDWLADWGVFYTVSKRDHSSTRGDFRSPEMDMIITNAQGAVFAEVPELAPANPATDLKNPLVLSSFARYEEDMETSDGSNRVAKFNIGKEYSIAGYQGSVKFGGKVRQTANSKFRNNRIFGFNDPNQITNPAEAFAHVIGRTEPISFLNGRFDYGPSVDRDRFNDYMDRYSRLVVEIDGWDAERLSKNDTYDAYEDVYAGYGMTRLQIDKLLILAGLRYEYNSVRYDAFEVLREGNVVVATPVTGGPNYGYLLPSLHLKYNRTPLQNIRFAYTQSYARPNFNHIVPFVNYDQDANRIYIGNPDLSAALAHNLDLMYELYDRKGGILSGGVFFKHIDRFQFTRNIPSLTENDFMGYPNTLGFEFSQEQNGEKALVYGLEINAIQQFTQLPGALSGLSVFANYTYTGADANTQDRFGMSLPGQARHTGNAAVSFDYKGFTSRVNLNYNGAFIHTVSSEEWDDIIQDQRFQLDVNFNQAITKRVSLYAEFMNLTNSPTRRYQGYSDRVYRLAYFGWWSRMGINFRF